MKKVVSLMLAMLLVLSMAACGSKFEWTREGYFMDDDNNLLTIYKTDDASGKEWYVGALFDDGMFGDVISLKGKTLHGNIAGDMADVDSYVVTISEEGEDGVMVEVENGRTMHFKYYEVPTASITVRINTKGLGSIAYAKEGEELEFEEDYRNTSAQIGLEGPATYTVGAKPDEEEGYKFKRWLLNGEAYSTEPIITMEFTENTELVAVFGIKGTDETPVDLDTVKTLGQVLGLPEYGSACYPSLERYVYVFEQDDIYYRAIAKISTEDAEKVFDIDYDDEKRLEKIRAIIAPLEVLSIENLSDTVLTEDQLNELGGKTVGELLGSGWSLYGWNLDTKKLNMSYGAFDYFVYYEDEIKNNSDIDDEAFKPIKVTRIEVDGFGDGTDIE